MADNTKLNESAQLGYPADVAEALRAHAGVYELMAGVFMKPLTQGQIDDLAGVDWLDVDPANDDMAQGLRKIARYLRKRHSGTRELLAVDYTSAFYGTHTYKGASAMPYESMHTGGEQRYMGSARTEVFNIYKHRAFKVVTDADIPEDHFSYECQFVALISKKAAVALEEGRDEDAMRDLMLVAEFIDKHLLGWIDAWHSVAVGILKERFYPAAMQAAKGFMVADRADLDSILEVIQEKSGIPLWRVRFKLSEWEKPNQG